MQLKNTANAYGWAAIALHWISAVGVIWLYILGEGIEHAKEDRLPREEISAMIEFHTAVGMVFLLFFVARIVGHVAQSQPRPPAQHTYLKMLSRMVMGLFLGMIAIQIVTGPLIMWTVPKPISIFGLFSIPTPFAERPESFHDALELVHKYAPNLFWPLIVLHVGGALKHFVIDRDDTLQRMLGFPKR